MGRSEWVVKGIVLLHAFFSSVCVVSILQTKTQS